MHRNWATKQVRTTLHARRIQKHLTGQSQVDVMRWIAKRQNLAKNDVISATARVTSAEISGFEASPRLKKPCCIEGKSMVAEPVGRAAMNDPPVICINDVKSEFGSSGRANLGDIRQSPH